MYVSELVKLIGGVKKHEISNDCTIIGAALDSRLVTDGNIFFAAKGESSDGNLYAQNALQSGASIVIMDDEDKYNKLKGNKALVNNTIEYLQSLGKRRFELSNVFKIAITGSFGKTGMKEIVKDIFSTDYKVYATSGNKNNMLGVTLTGAGIDDEAEILVIEMGTSNEGEIKALTNVVKPDMAIITSIGHAHIGRFKSIENIINEKLSISKGLKSGGTLIIPEQVKKYVPKGAYKIITFGSGKADVEIETINHNSSNISFKVNKISRNLKMNTPYVHVVSNSLAAITAAIEKNIDENNIAKGLLKYAPTERHGSISVAGDLTIIDDTYNAGFESIIKAAESLSYIKSSQKHAIFGEMGEIEGHEAEFYAAVAKLAERYDDINFYLCGKSYESFPTLANRKIYKDKATLLKYLNEISEGTVLIKASHAMKFDEVADCLKSGAKGVVNAL